ncbi:MAG: YdeI/OmpD-associated family protein [Flavobacteriales bacterium]|nr:YdeI/OmpD-associated family protein [Flavobacteriales bacterium]
MKRYPTVKEYIMGHPEHLASLEELRAIMLSTELVECVKWGGPCYTIGGKNVVGIGAFKSYVGIWFFQGVFLKDPNGVLVNAQEGVTKALRQWRFNSVEEIDSKLIVRYVEEAIANEKAGKKVKPLKKPLIIPIELQKELGASAQLLMCYDSLSLSCKREYAEYISEAKREETKAKRLDKIIPMITEGKGLNDKYKKS